MLTRRQLLALGLAASPAYLARRGPLARLAPRRPDHRPTVQPFQSVLPIPADAIATRITPDELIRQRTAEPGAVPQRDPLTPEFIEFIRQITSPEIDLYDMEAREADLSLLPGAETRVWGYNGLFPGPTIHAVAGRTSVLRLTNNLPAFSWTGLGTVVHLHGGHTPPEWDGFPDEFTRFGTSRVYVYPNRHDVSSNWNAPRARG